LQIRINLQLTGKINLFLGRFLFYERLSMTITFNNTTIKEY